MKLTWRKILIALVLGIALVYCLPTLFSGWWPHKTINLGLDLQGGMHLVLEVETEKAVESTIERTIYEIKKELREERVTHAGIEKTSSNNIHAALETGSDLDEFNRIIADKFGNLEIDSSGKSGGRTKMVLSLPEKERKDLKKMSTEQALETIRNRIDEFGVNEPDIRIQGDSRILIQLPGIKDTSRAKDLIGRTAQLTFQLVDEENSVQEALEGNPPVGDEILYQHKEDPATGSVDKRPFLVKKRVLLDGSMLTDARVQFDEFNQAQVGIEFNRKGARIFEKITGENLNKRLAIVLDDKVYSAPTIQSEIAGGKAVITGRFTAPEARDLAIALRAGALPAPVKIIEERTVGPTLGADSIRKGLLSMVIGGAFVLFFMVVYYKRAGLIADVALLANMVLIGGGLAAFQATLTLPGIAGIILTIGMAVDANVIIFERIREELRAGKTTTAAVNSGFDRAALTIMDANVTTLIAAIVLFQFGTGPVKGFAVTLSLGIISSLFTALILSKGIFEFILEKRQVKQLSI
ncbi:MAG: protein translocase subunit SecD [Desulfobacteraceae bacterium]